MTGEGKKVKILMSHLRLVGFPLRLKKLLDLKPELCHKLIITTTIAIGIDFGGVFLCMGDFELQTVEGPPN